jgi:hypothetical protein
MNMINLTPAQLRQAADLKEQIATLNHQLAALFGGSGIPAPVTVAKPVVAKKRGMSAAGRAAVAAAQKARWAKLNGAKSVVKPAATPAKVAVVAKPAKKKFVMSAAAKAKISAAAKARWAKVKGAKK